MDIINKLATEYSNRTFSLNTSRNADKIINEVRSATIDINNKADKIKYITIVLEKNNLALTKHREICNKSGDCPIEKKLEHISYFLNQDLEELGLIRNEYTFSMEEKAALESRIDDLLTELASLKAGQQIIYEDLLKELEDLKELLFLGKKNWRQLLIGKVTEMVAGGVISETVAHSIATALKPLTSNLIES